MDVRSGKWEKVTPLGEPPSPRAAHAAAAVGNMVVVQVRSSRKQCRSRGWLLHMHHPVQCNAAALLWRVA